MKATGAAVLGTCFDLRSGTGRMALGTVLFLAGTRRALFGALVVIGMLAGDCRAGSWVPVAAKDGQRMVLPASTVKAAPVTIGVSTPAGCTVDPDVMAGELVGSDRQMLITASLLRRNLPRADQGGRVHRPCVAGE
jgi:hypothetical protein